MGAELERCSECRDGWTAAPEWTAWYCRADELTGEDLSQHLDERPTGEPEIECQTCGGTGRVPAGTGRVLTSA